ncbi:MAG: CHAT domain-containing protein, partial [Bacteroidota bacterium]
TMRRISLRGQLVRGEGVISLARGFMHAGCPSTVMSLWSVDDCATSDIMVHFYRSLKAGQRKDEAIRQAKFDYLANISDKSMAHPYYWAAFVQFGQTEALTLKAGTPFTYWWLSLLLLPVLLIFWGRNRSIGKT